MNYVTKLNYLFLIEGQEYYNLTSCIAHQILYNLRVDIDYTIDLLLYPSVLLNQNELNFAIHPRLVDSEFMNIKEVYKFKLKEKKEDDGLSFNFDVSGVKKYNTNSFRNSTAVAKKITKNGILATVQPDGVDILVGFDDITETANAFFKVKK